MGDHDGPEEPILDIPNRIIRDPRMRGWLYGVGLAVALLLGGYGIITAEQGHLWLTLLGAILGTGNGVAIANLPRPAP